MWMICKKEWQQFFSSLSGYIALAVFLLLNGLFLFVFPTTSILDFGYATLAPYFNLAPWILLFLVPTITMRGFADEYKSGTFEILKTLPLSPTDLVLGKFFGALLILVTALLPTLLYAFSIQALSITGGIDMGAATGAYLGLLLLGASFLAIGLCASSFTANTVVAFIAAAFVCLLLFQGFESIGTLSFFKNGMGYYVEMLGINFHYKSMSRGVIDSRDLLYFSSLLGLCFFLTHQNLRKH